MDAYVCARMSTEVKLQKRAGSVAAVIRADDQRGWVVGKEFAESRTDRLGRRAIRLDVPLVDDELSVGASGSGLQHLVDG